jgi:hypothetical protein
VPVVLKIRSFIEVPVVKVQLTLPNGIEMISSQDTWEGELTAGSLKELTFILKVKGSGRYVVGAMATLQFQGGMKMAKSARLLIDLEPQPSLGAESVLKAKEKRKFRTIKSKDGRDLKIFFFEKVDK